MRVLKTDWKPTGIKNNRYELYKNSDGLLTIWLDGKIIPNQTDLTWNQKMDEIVSVTVTVLFI